MEKYLCNMPFDLWEYAPCKRPDKREKQWGYPLGVVWDQRDKEQDARNAERSKSWGIILKVGVLPTRPVGRRRRHDRRHRDLIATTEGRL